MVKFKDNVPGFPGYHVTSDGKVYSMKCRFGQRPKAFLLKPRLCNNGYYRVGLYKDGIKYEWRLHRLVATVYIPNPDNLPLVCHIDNNPLNCKASNLYWGSDKDNIRDREKALQGVDRSRGLVLHSKIRREAYRLLRLYSNYKLSDIRKALNISRNVERKAKKGL